MVKDGIEFDIRNTYLYGKSLSNAGKTDDAINIFKKLINDNINEYSKHRWFLYHGILELADCYHRKQEQNKELDTLFIVLKNQIPTIEILNKISDCLLRDNKYKEAVFWLELATTIDDNSFTKEHNRFVAYLKLGYSYFKIKEYQKAFDANEVAGRINPTNGSFLNNKEIYQKYLEK